MCVNSLCVFFFYKTKKEKLFDVGHFCFCINNNNYICFDFYIFLLFLLNPFIAVSAIDCEIQSVSADEIQCIVQTGGAGEVEITINIDGQLHLFRRSLTYHAPVIKKKNIKEQKFAMKKIKCSCFGCSLSSPRPPPPKKKN